MVCPGLAVQTVSSILKVIAVSISVSLYFRLSSHNEAGFFYGRGEVELAVIIDIFSEFVLVEMSEIFQCRKYWIHG